MIKASVIFVHYGMTKPRRELAIMSYKSLYESIKHFPCELIVVDNGGGIEESRFFLEETEKGNITHYIRNSDNVWFGRARNQALRICEGDYISIVDNDLIYQNGWLDKCIEALEKNKDKQYLSTPMPIIRCHRKYTRIEDGLILNTFAGSNCWVMRKEDAQKIGEFDNHHFAGTLWCRTYGKIGYSVIVIEGNLVEDYGNKYGKYIGYAQETKKKENREILIKKKLLNGEEIIYFRGEIWH